MGILKIVAIPAVSRTIENSGKDTLGKVTRKVKYVPYIGDGVHGVNVTAAATPVLINVPYGNITTTVVTESDNLKRGNVVMSGVTNTIIPTTPNLANVKNGAGTRLNATTPATYIGQCVEQ